MRGNAEITADFNTLLTGELTAMDVYFVQSRICHNWGFHKLTERWAHEMEDETRHAESLIKRILFLEGAPDLRQRISYSIAASVEEMLKSNLELEIGVAKHLREVIAKCETLGDHGSRMVLEELLEDTENDHILWLETQLKLISKVGLENYLQSQI